MKSIRRGCFGTSASMSLAKLNEDFDKYSKEYDSEEQTPDSFWNDELYSYNNEKESKRLLQTANAFLHHIGSAKKNEIKDNFSRINTSLFNIPCEAAVLSVDIRNSTFLMDHCDDPKRFSNFIYTITKKFKDIVISNYGVYDKFTGDGFICYFPDFFSGPDYLYYAVKTATQCHEAFDVLYQKEKHIFDIIMSEEGLGIGIDVGPISIKMITDDITIIGKPVVNACRLNSAPAGETLINNKANFLINQKYPTLIKTKESKLKYKHIGDIQVYQLIDFNENKSIIVPKIDLMF